MGFLAHRWTAGFRHLADVYAPSWDGGLERAATIELVSLKGLSIAGSKFTPLPRQTALGTIVSLGVLRHVPSSGVKTNGDAGWHKVTFMERAPAGLSLCHHIAEGGSIAATDRLVSRRIADTMAGALRRIHSVCGIFPHATDCIGAGAKRKHHADGGGDYGSGLHWDSPFG